MRVIAIPFSSMQLRRAHKLISKIRDQSEEWQIDKDIIHSNIMNYFNAIFSSSLSNVEHVANGVSNRLSTHDKFILDSNLPFDGIFTALSNMGSNKAPKPERMTVEFYKAF